MLLNNSALVLILPLDFEFATLNCRDTVLAYLEVLSMNLFIVLGLLYPGVPERWKGMGGQLFQRALSIQYVQSLPPTLLSNTVKQLNT